MNAAPTPPGNQRTPRAVVVGLGDYYDRLKDAIWKHFEVVRLVDVRHDLDLHREARAVFVQSKSLDDIGVLGCGADIAILLTPNIFHTEQVIRALAAGLAVVAEKPVAVALYDLEKLSATVGSDSPVYFSDAYVDVRALPLLWFAERLHESDHRLPWIRTFTAPMRLGALGRVRTIRARLMESYPFRSRSWLASTRQGGGVIADMMVHLFALIRALYPDEELAISHVSRQFRGGVSETGAYAPRPRDDDEAEARAAVVGVLIQRGIEVSLEVAKDWHRNERWLTIEGERGVVTQSFEAEHTLTVETDTGQAEVHLAQGHHHALTVEGFKEWWLRDRRRYGWECGQWAARLVVASRGAGAADRFDAW